MKQQKIQMAPEKGACLETDVSKPALYVQLINDISYC